MLALLALAASGYTAEAFETLRGEEAARIAAGAAVDDSALSKGLKDALGIADRGQRDEALMRFAARLVAIGDREPERAVRWLPSLPNKGNDIPRLRATEHLFRRWVHRDAQRAATAALQLWRDGNGHPVGDLLHEWASFAPAGAIAWVQALDDRERTQLAAYEQLLGALPAVDHLAALELAESVPPRFSYALVGAYSQILPHLVSTDVDAAVAAYDRYEARAPEDAKKCVAALVRAWAERQPEKDVAFAESRLGPTEPRRYLALLGVASTWARASPRSAADLALRAIREQRRMRAFDPSYNHHAPKQDPLGDIVASWAEKSRAAARRWVETIDETDLRDHLLQVLGVERSKPPPPRRQPDRNIGATSSPTEIKYRLIHYYGGVFFCDVDMYPVHDSTAEQRRALETFAKIAAGAAHYGAILRHLGAAEDPNPSPELKLRIYREHKKLDAVKLDAAPGGYAYELRVREAVVTGVVERGMINETGRKQQFNTCPVCLAETTRIDTPSGAVPVTELRVGSIVWTRDTAGVRVAAPVLRLGSSRAPAGHSLVRLALRDGRRLSASANHPLADGRRLGELSAGQAVDGTALEAVELVPYDGAATYDLLPAGDTGVYWADGVPLATTLD